MNRILILTFLFTSVYSQSATDSYFSNLPAILDAQSRIIDAYYRNRGGQANYGTPSRVSSGVPSIISSAGSPFGAGFPFNNPSIQNYVQNSINSALGNSGINPTSFITNPQNNIVNPPTYVINPQNNGANYVQVPPSTPAPVVLSRRPTFQYPDVKNSLNSANSVLKSIGGGLSFPFGSLFGR